MEPASGILEAFKNQIHILCMHKTRSIASTRFLSALQNALGIFRIDQFPKMGLAVSGGVDSMAMLCLWNELLRQSKLPSDSKYEVFLVDHKARPGSSNEVQHVARQVHQLTGQSARILTLDWGVQDPAVLPNFESCARSLRFQALGRACFDHGISKLMLAHHRDDKVETIIQRIAASHHSTSLIGVAPAAQIPECEGQYGIYESGSPVPLDPQADPQSWLYETGGVTVIRPLLSFSKNQLIDTCISNSTSWHEDRTNHDPTFTQRNAVRVMINSKKLPAALEGGKLLALSNRMIAKANQWSLWRDQFLSQCVVESFDVRCGELRILIPSRRDVSMGKGFPRSKANDYYLCHLVVQYLVELITPREAVNSRTFATAVVQIFPEFPDLRIPPANPDFNVAGVRFRRFSSYGQTMGYKSTEQSPVVGSPRDATNSIHGSHNGRSRRRYTSWEMTREKPRATSGPAAIYHAPVPGGSGSDIKSGGNADIEAPQPPGKVALPNTWNLWDGRYWISVESDIALETDMLDIGEFRQFRRKCLADARARQSRSAGLGGLEACDITAVGRIIRAHPHPGAIPALVQRKETTSVEARETIVALPTFGLVHPAYKDVVRWRVHYKQIDVKPLALRSDPFNSPVLLTKP